MILLLCGKCASGKDAILKKLVETNTFQKIVSYTTRPKRINEINGVDYVFVSFDTFRDMKNQGKFFQTREYQTLLNGKKDTWYYGSQRVTNERIPHAAIVDLGGVESYINEYGKDNIYCVYIDVDDATRRERAEKRGSFDESEWNRRLADDTKAFDINKVNKLANLCISNTGDISDAIFEIVYGFYEHIVKHGKKKPSYRSTKFTGGF